METLKRNAYREISHIINMWKINKVPTGYNIKFESNRTNSIGWLLRNKLIECVNIVEKDKAFYIYVKPIE